MLSILIPIYNFNCSALVQELHTQCSKLKIEFEIICLDDGSESALIEKLYALGELQSVSFEALQRNLGRAKIRNLLAQKANYEYLLFLDCDSGIDKDDFVKTYLENVQSNTLIYGGRNYKNSAPTDQNQILHWHYGRSREALSVSERKKDPSLNFLTNNFIVPRSLMLNYPFNESVKGYGYEDTAFANKMSANGIKILHIENSTLHLCMEQNIDFLKKTENAIRNLSNLYASKEIKSSRLIDMYQKLKDWRILKFVNLMTQKNKSRFVKNLMSKKPRLVYFSLLKLWLFSQCINGQEESFFS